MKTKFAKEKSEYAHLLVKAINLKLEPYQRVAAINRLKEIEYIIKEQGDEIIFIVTTKDTNNHESAPPMSMEDIKNS